MIHVLMLLLSLVIFSVSFIPLQMRLHFFMAFFIAAIITILVLLFLPVIGFPQIITFDLRSCNLPGCSIVEMFKW